MSPELGPKGPRSTVLPWVLWAVLFGAVLFVVAGCSSTFNGLCALQPVGQTDSGITVVRTHCEAE